jgi:UDP-N-acetylglucosamine 3-dehydrogenase
MAEKVGVGIIGCGVISRTHVKRYLNNPNVKIVAVCDIIEEKAKEVAKLAGTETWYADYNEMLKRADIQAVSVCTPHPIHVAPSIAAANAGKHILCEKPMCTKLKDANAMVEAVRRNKVKFQVGYQSYFGAGMQAGKRLIDEGYLGRIHEICSVGGSHQIRSDADWFYRKEAGGGVTVDWTTYTLYHFRYFMGKVKTMFARRALNEPIKQSRDHPGETVQLEVEDTISMLMTFENEAIGLIYNSWSSGFPHGYFEVVGMEGVLAGSPMGSILSTSKVGLPELAKDGRILLPTDPPGFDAHQAKINHFIDCILNDKEPAVPVEIGRDVVEMAEAAYRSIAQNKPVDLPLEP